MSNQIEDLPEYQELADEFGAEFARAWLLAGVEGAEKHHGVGACEQVFPSRDFLSRPDDDGMDDWEEP